MHSATIYYKDQYRELATKIRFFDNEDHAYATAQWLLTSGQTQSVRLVSRGRTWSIRQQ